MSYRSVVITIMMILGVLYTLHFARDVLVPFTVAMLGYLLFIPLVVKLKKIGVPSSLSAAVILGGLLFLLFSGISALKQPATDWMVEAPYNLRQLTKEFREIKGPLEDIKNLSEEVEEITQLDTSESDATEVEIKDPTILDKVMTGIPTFLVLLMVTVMTCFFLLAGGDGLTKKVLTFGRSWDTKLKILKAFKQIQKDVSKYLRTVTLINLFLGTAVGIAMWWLEVPNPELWGAMVAILNFAPYVGAIASTVVLTVVGASTFDSLGEAALVPGLFLVLTTIEGALFTPLVLGRSLSLNPLVVFMSVIVWGWLWGVVGALIAVPLISSIKVILSHIEATQPFANLMESNSARKLAEDTNPSQSEL